jgi:hypothetical protein
MGDDDASCSLGRGGIQHHDQAAPDGGADDLGGTYRGTDPGAMPANVSENIRPMVTAEFANEVELVNQWAAPM